LVGIANKHIALSLDRENNIGKYEKFTIQFMRVLNVGRTRLKRTMIFSLHNIARDVIS
jgi:hypothetical protein